MIKLQKLLLFLITLPASLQAEFLLLDQGLKVISGPVGNTIITHSDVYQKLSLDGKVISLQDQIETEVIRQQVVADKMPLDDTAADKYLDNVQKTNNLTVEDLEELANQCYRTFAELKQQLSLNYIRDFFLHHKFRSHLVPTDQEVEEYCVSNPEIEPGYCVMQVSQIPFGADKKAVSEKVKGIQSGLIDRTTISWSDSIRVELDDLAEDMQFVKNMARDEVIVIEGKTSFELYHLIEMKDEIVIPIKDRKAFVIDTLNRQMYEDLLTKYKSHMLDNVGIIHLTA